MRLDAATLRDLRALRGRVPFSATSPLGARSGAYAASFGPLPGSPIDGRPTVAVRFEAEGVMTGPLPGYAETLVSGTMRMDGTAYYALDGAMLLALNVTLTLDARLAPSRPSVSVPVRILYRRTMGGPLKCPHQLHLQRVAEGLSRNSVSGVNARWFWWQSISVSMPRLTHPVFSTYFASFFLKYPCGSRSTFA